jgi:hypothetical protein
MPEPLIDRLSRLTPDGAGLDRDALLFAAGRASLRPNRRWVALAGALAASQLMTLALLWPRPAPFDEIPVAAIESRPAVEAPSPMDHEAPSLWSLRERALNAEGELSPTVSVEHLVPAAPPLHAFGTVSSVILN